MFRRIVGARGVLRLGLARGLQQNRLLVLDPPALHLAGFERANFVCASDDHTVSIRPRHGTCRSNVRIISETLISAGKASS